MGLNNAEKDLECSDMVEIRQFDNATTMWESWFFSDNTFSHNHPMFGSSEVWLLQSVAGIQPHPSAKGMHHVLIKPSPPSRKYTRNLPLLVMFRPLSERLRVSLELEHASGSFQTPRGKIETSWERKSGGGFTLKTSIPPNVIATVRFYDTYVVAFGYVLDVLWNLAQVHVPSRTGGTVMESGNVLEGARQEEGSVVLEIGSGEYTFTSTV